MKKIYINIAKWLSLIFFVLSLISLFWGSTEASKPDEEIGLAAIGIVCAIILFLLSAISLSFYFLFTIENKILASMVVGSMIIIIILISIYLVKLMSF
jgi:uncharacterized membrane protein